MTPFIRLRRKTAGSGSWWHFKQREEIGHESLLRIPEIRFIKAEGLDIRGNDPDELLREAIESI